MSYARLTLVRPLDITPAMLVDTDVPETDYPAWSSATTYGAGNRVIVAADHAVYESLQASNLANAPSPLGSTAWWIKVSPTNRWKAFDRANSSKTAKANSMYFEIAPGQAVNAVGLLAMRRVFTARVRVTDVVSGVVFDRSYMVTDQIREPSWYEWLFGARIERTSVTDLELPSYPNATIRVDLSGAADMQIGVILLGQQITVGHSVSYGAAFGLTSYSRKEADEFGEVNLKKRKTAKRTSLPLVIKNEDLDGLQDLFAEIDADPCLWVGGVYQSLTVYGFYKDFEVVISGPSASDCLLEIEGMT